MRARDLRRISHSFTDCRQSCLNAERHPSVAEAARTSGASYGTNQFVPFQNCGFVNNLSFTALFSARSGALRRAGYTRRASWQGALTAAAMFHGIYFLNGEDEVAHSIVRGGAVIFRRRSEGIGDKPIFGDTGQLLITNPASMSALAILRFLSGKLR